MVPRSLILRFARYGVASATGTVIDLLIYGGLLALGLFAGVAAAIGYACGTAWHWMLSSRIVFADRFAQPGPERVRQRALFIGSALLGLGLTTAIVAGMTGFGFDPASAKFAAMCVAFTSVWLVRLTLVFAPDPGAADEGMQ
jgi:putative flippase GtrA